ncbi:hypothetical protein ABB26_05155 [Stenotrophomonas humi]|uniref:Uncharacterized protein n=1 Tax=Stenotrophomonas humi TaxID=405444 RepID=A0A0R0CFV1_9GAMM|nr:hypothetical protein [Stenotrophomonas humi]KRG65194.1 hypothetical protein ABB26_05155 [Stenotrophomonas humi]
MGRLTYDDHVTDYLDTEEVRARMALAAAEFIGEWMTGPKDAYATQKCGRQFNELADKIESSFIAEMERRQSVEADNVAELRECAA